ncbi:MAG TPA: 4-hydroxy-tetrahydrodipicolinate synthase [Elusimicrobiota bacterium]|nr:4-hydroxy-tetrahydrodipicolinate synthase [Elusimicrobiota bacterium]
MKIKFSGCYTALVTPFRSDLSLDEAALRRLVRAQIAGGVSGLVPCGSTGEASALEHAEWRRVLAIAIEEAAGRLPVVAGISANATAKASSLAREAQALGADALLVVCPYYNKPTQEGLYRHFSAVAKAAGIPLILYNIPGRTAVNLAPSTALRLARDYPSIRAIKEASGSLDQASEILAGAPRGFAVLSGDDSLTLPMMAAGAAGVVSVLSNVAPKKVAALCRDAAAERSAAARRAHLGLFGLTKALFAETNPIPVKAALSMMGLCRDLPRPPLTRLSAKPRAALRRALQNAGLI